MHLLYFTVLLYYIFLLTVYISSPACSTIISRQVELAFLNSTDSGILQKSHCLRGFFAIAKYFYLVYHITMNDDIIKANIAKNITWHRKRKGMTQAELAEAISYSDKSVSKWERGEGLPDVCVLTSLAELFGVTLNDLVTSDDPQEKIDPRPSPEEKKSQLPITQRVLVPLMAMGLVWLVAAVLFFTMELFVSDFTRDWLILLWAIPVSCIVSIVFAALWWSIVPRLVSTSALIWALACCVFLTFSIQKIQYIFVIAAVLQILSILWFLYIGSHRKHKS